MSHEFEITGLELTYPYLENKVLKGIDLKIAAGTIHVLLGQNGSGKTSFMRCMAGLQHWTAGDILRRGQSRQYDTKDFNEDLLLVSEDIDLPNYTIRDLARIYGEIWGKSDSSVLRRILSYANISDAQKPTQLSRGQKALTQLALALSSEIKTLLVDEITAALDPYVRNRVVDELVQHNQFMQATIIASINIATEFAGVDANLIMLDQGKVFLSGRVESLAKEFALIRIPANRISEYTTNFVELTRVGKTERLLIGKRSDCTPEIVISDTDITLEHLFIYLTGRRAA